MSVFRIKDPIYPEFRIGEFNSYFPLMKSYPVNRLRFIKQLGLKAYSGRFPSANHTRYEHSIGTMHLSRELCGQLYKNTEDLDLRGSVKEYQSTIEIAALLHDIGHGPFSHVIDSILERFGKSHERITVEIIENLLKDDIKSLGLSIDIDDVCSIILGENRNHAYLNDIIHGHLDVDRMDYLARDAYFTATEYQWRAYSLLQLMRLSKIPKIEDKRMEELKHEIESSKLPRRDEIKGAIDLIKDLWTDHVCICNEDGIVHAEMMLVTRRTMYENVYYESSSRIAESMISKGILWMIDKDNDKKNYFLKPEEFVKLDDCELLTLLKHSGGFAEEIVNKIKEGRFFSSLIEGKVVENNRLKEAVGRRDQSEIESINNEIANVLDVDPERVLLDVIVRKGFEKNRVFVEIGEIPRPIEDVSGIIRSLIKSLEKEMTFGIYIDDEKVEKGNKLKDVIAILKGDKKA